MHLESPRPSVAPSSFKLFHQTENSLTLVTEENATDDQISAILWQLRDAAKAHSFDAIHLPQNFIDKRDPIVWFHVYRGSKCASEKYGNGKYPCGPSYHAAGDYTLGSFSDHNHDDAVLYQSNGKEQHLWL